MTEEITLSIEETNKLRASIGLPLIPISSSDNNSKKQNTAHRKESKAPSLKPNDHSSFKQELSIEETNTLRLSLGLKPIPVDSNNEPKISRNDASSDFPHKNETRDDQTVASSTDTATEARIENLKRNRLEHKSESTKKRKASPSLLWDDIGNGSDGADSWLDNLGKKQDPSPRKLPKAEPNKTNESDLSRFRIGHSFKELAEIDGDHIFTLKDTDILQNEDENDPDDELENEDLIKSKKLKQEKKEIQRMNDALYSNSNNRFDSDSEYEEDEERAENHLRVRNMLAFNEYNNRNKNDNASVDKLELDKTGNTVELSGLFDDLDAEDTSEAVDLDYSKSKKPVKMKKLSKSSKSKLKSKSSSRSKSTSSSRSKLQDVSDDESNIPFKEVSLDIEGPEEENDELQQLLDLKRRQKQSQSRSKLTPEQIAQEVRRNAQLDAINEIEQRNQVGISSLGDQVYDDTTDFLNSLSLPEVGVKREVDDIKHEEHEEVPIQDESNVKQETDNSHIKVKSEPNTEAEFEQDATDLKRENAVSGNLTDNTQQPSFSSTGLAGTLQYLQSRNIVSRLTAEQDEQAKQQRQAVKEAELLKLQLSIEERVVREELEADKKFMNLPREQRETQIQDLVEHRLRERGVLPDVTITADRGPAKRYSKYKSFKSTTNDKLANFNPQVKLEYRDEEGNDLNTKEAFKFLSHRFHGVGPGKGKVEKRLRKQQDARSLSEANNEHIL